MGLEVIGPFLIKALPFISAASSIIGGVEQSREAGRQADIAAREAETEARVEARENIQFEKRQKLAFLKSGVLLEGTPLTILRETRIRGGENIEAIQATGAARVASFRSQGRAALLQGFGAAAKTAAVGFA